MKRRQKLALTLLLLPSLFLSLTCGIPHFINLDSAISFASVTSNKDLIEYKVRITEKGMAKVNELEVKPALKFFYTFGTIESVIAPPSNKHNDVYELSTIPSRFSTNMKGSMGNGVLWGPESSNSAPGFYLYTKDNNSTNNFARSSRGIVNRHPEESGVLIGTFSQSETDSQNYHFGTAPDMDLPLATIDAYSGSGTYEFNFKLEKEDHAEGFLIKLESDGDDLLLRTHQKNPFPNHATIERLNQEDSNFYSFIVEEARNTELYLHIWVSLYGGAGQFTNVYWSPLRHIGALELF